MSTSYSHNLDEADSLNVSTEANLERILTQDEILDFIHKTIRTANRKYNRESITISENATSEQIQKAYQKAGRKIFAYFKEHCEDPPLMALQLQGKPYKEVGIEQFWNFTLQNRKLNSKLRDVVLRPLLAFYSYEELVLLELQVLKANQKADSWLYEMNIPDVVVQIFGEACQKAKLLDAEGRFNDPIRLLNFFCS